MITTCSRKARRVSDNLKLGKLIGWLWFACILTSAVSTQRFYTGPRYGKRKETGSLATFQTGSRFGRLDLKNTKASPKMIEIVPRVDRLFYVSRYGKRSSSRPSPLPLERRYDDVLKFLGRMKKAAIDESAANRLDYETVDGGRFENLDGHEPVVDSYLCDGPNAGPC